jgi:acetylornithine/N-succinyldiaminopimelate aminotransferase
VLRVFDEEKVVENAERVGQHLRSALEARFGGGRVPSAVGIRGRGLLQGIALAPEVDPLATLAAIRERRLLLTLAGGNVLRISPPLVVSPAEIDEGLEIVAAVLADPPRTSPKVSP